MMRQEVANFKDLGDYSESVTISIMMINQNLNVYIMTQWHGNIIRIVGPNIDPLLIETLRVNFIENWVKISNNP